MTVSAVNVYPSGQSVYISTRGQLGFARHGSCENEIQLIAQAATPTRSWTLIGCSPPGDGTVYLKTRYQGRTITLDTISIDVWAAPTMPTGTPVAVSNLSAAASTTSARLTWARLDGAEKYRVAHRAGGTTGNWLNPVETTARAHTVPNLAPGTSYQFRVRAYGDGETYLAEWGAEATITASTLDTTPSKPPPPAGFTASASADTAGRVTLTWDTRAGVARYEVRYRRGSGSWTVRPNITGTGSKITHHVDGLTCGASHDFRVKAYGDGATYLAEWGDEAEDDAAPLCNPDAPGGLNASAPGENSVSVSWTALTGADKYAVRYQQGSSGDWAEYRDDITGTSPTVSGLRCDTGYRFSVRAYGDGVTLARDWGEWSSASDEIRTSTCTTTTPTGWIEASPATIAVGQTTTITAGWSNVAQTKIEASSTALAASCGITGASVTGPQQTQVWTGCSDGTVAVTLRNAADNKILASVTVTVLEAPTITQAVRIAYRWFNISWSADSAYTAFSVEWRDKGNADWNLLKPRGSSGARALVNDQLDGAAIRGIPYVSAPNPAYPPDRIPKLIELRLVATVASAMAYSRVYSVERGPQPYASGHLRDHTMKYDLSLLDESVNTALAGWVRNLTPSYANTWSSIVPSLEACQEGTCQKGGSKYSLMVQIDDTNRAVCGNTKLGCVKHNPIPPSVETAVYQDRPMAILAAPKLSTVHYTWTSLKALDGDLIPDSSVAERRFAWINSGVAHELGHAFNLRDRDGMVDYYGIMDGKDDVIGKKDDGIKSDDRNVLTAIYAAHTKNEGW